MNSIPKAFDLLQAADAVQRSPTARPFRKAVRALYLTNSCATDLRRVVELVQLVQININDISGITPGQRSLLEDTTLTTALVLYVRATRGGTKQSGDRGSVKIDHRLTPQQRQTHAKLVDLRNGAIAHVRRGSEYAGTAWNEDLVLAIEDKAGFEIKAVSRTVINHDEVWRDVGNLAPVAYNIMVENLWAQRTEIEQAVETNAVLRNELRKHGVDPTAFFKNEDTARYFLNRRAGNTVFTTSE